MKLAITIFWRLFMVYSIVSYTDATINISAGAFDNIGLPMAMIGQELVGNALQAIGWSAVLILSLRKNPLFAPELCFFLGGMLFFDVQTTWPLDMPLPPGFLYWGTGVVIISLFAGLHLAKQRRCAQEFV
ncbi:MAG: hypothetical protein ACR2O7_00530 [Parasphingorhabdus sp.]